MNDEYILEYHLELKQLDQRKLSPTGIYSHLETYEEFVKWKKRNNDLFFYDDEARNLT